MREWEAHRIPHLVSDTEFASMPKSTARQELGVDPERPTILFLASAGVTDQRKGFDLLEEALPSVRRHVPDLQVLVGGPVTPQYSSPSNATIAWLGELQGNAALRTAYSAADALVAPSREDNMPLTAMEAQMCGLPVAAFRIGGLPDIVDHQRTGYLADPFNCDALADGILQTLKNRAAWGPESRERALREWSADVVVTRYRNLYTRMLGGV